MRAASSQPGLIRSIGLPHAIALVVGTIVGASIFVQPAEVSRNVPSLAGTFAVWMVAGALTFCGAMVCAELSSAFPQSGGVYVFLREGVSTPVAFLWGWAMFVTMHTGIIAASSVILARHLGYFIALDETEARAVAIAAIVALSAVNYAGVRKASAFQVAVTVTKLLAIALLLGLGLAAVLRTDGLPAASAPAEPGATASTSISAFAIAVGACLFTFGGWHMVTYSAEETRDAPKTIPRALVIGIFAVTVCYLGINAICLGVLPMEQIANSPRVAADVAQALAGPNGGAAIAALVLFSSLSVLNGVILAGPRVYLAMSRDGLLFDWMSKIHPRFHTPYAGIVAQCIWASVLVATTTYRALFTRVIYTEWIFFALMTIGLFRLRRRPGYAPVYGVWGYPLAPAIFVVAALLVAVYQMWADIEKAATGLLLVLIGLPAYFFLIKGRSHADH